MVSPLGHQHLFFSKKRESGFEMFRPGSIGKSVIEGLIQISFLQKPNFLVPALNPKLLDWFGEIMPDGFPFLDFAFQTDFPTLRNEKFLDHPVTRGPEDQFRESIK